MCVVSKNSKTFFFFFAKLSRPVRLGVSFPAHLSRATFHIKSWIDRWEEREKCLWRDFVIRTFLWREFKRDRCDLYVSCLSKQLPYAMLRQMKANDKKEKKMASVSLYIHSLLYIGICYWQENHKLNITPVLFLSPNSRIYINSPCLFCSHDGPTRPQKGKRRWWIDCPSSSSSSLLLKEINPHQREETLNVKWKSVTRINPPKQADRLAIASRVSIVRKSLKKKKEKNPVNFHDDPDPL